ncbi:DUF2845 domain-containing protein [Azotobacter chroococcum]|uniref:DUF2845 domain-containing protein n=1 Tax=Azotobacter chroococcum TaxID=353 RepID=A0AAP9YE00_9GAMM|nr:DUF2845 domain-containing protein [Azotobacter chroococcum]QQE89555.1 DUF2845 domain-containing protein [Azotobacter chroococcum]TBW39105.1 DUF2845 domain-containing protein [Azotobacter chroococcum]
MNLLRLLTALFGLAPALLLAASLRCENHLISTGDSTHEVLGKCGEPASRDLLGYRERRDDWGFHHELVVEEWVYGPRNGMYYFLRFEGNRLVGIDSRRVQ